MLKSGKSPIDEFLDSLSSKESQKVVWVLQLIEEADIVSTKFYKSLSATDDIVEVRAQHGNNSFRLLGFEHNGTIVVLTMLLEKKTKKFQKKR